MKEILIEALESIYGRSIEIKNSRPVGGGSINRAEVLTLSNRENVFLKTNAHPPDGFFQAEARGLDLLGQAKGGPRIPKPLGHEPDPGQKFLLLEYVENSPPTEEFDVTFAQALAAMHRSTQNTHGLDHDNFIGSTAQINTLDKNGLKFFRDRRIKFQQELARVSGKLPAPLDKRIDTLCDKLETLLDTGGEKPALLHGDLWSGNYFQARSDHRPCIFDPAVYYGLRESDLAMTQLFGSLTDSFYRAYHEAFPLSPGYAERRDIYNLYHMLNHLNLFGGSYLSSVETIVNRFIR
jgi:protein-ribulosamine 3-kinase